MLQSHPLKVFFPEGGTLFVCQWWTHSKQNNLILARSENSIRRMLASAYEKYSDAFIVKIFEAELVAPSALMCQKASVQLHLETINDFLGSVTGELHTLLEHKLPLPYQFTRCDKWEDSYLEDGEVREDPDDIELKWHPNCRNCMNGFRLTNLSPEQFYTRYHAQWGEVFAKSPANKSPEKYVACYSKARIARDDEKIWVATPNFGHHSSGIDLEELEPGTLSGYHVLFYFKILRSLDATPFQTILADLQKAEAIKCEAKREDRDRLQREQELVHANKVLSIFMKDEDVA